MDATLTLTPTWTIDPAHTRTNFSVRHMMISTVRGEFEKLSGTVEFNPDYPGLTTVDIQIAADSINTSDVQRDAHLKSPDFLDADKYPYLTFRSKRVEPVDATRARLVGDLTIRDITREVVLDVEFHGTAKSPWGATAAGFTAAARINRKDWNLTWNVALESGGVLVAETINVEIELEILQQ